MRICKFLKLARVESRQWEIRTYVVSALWLWRLHCNWIGRGVAAQSRSLIDVDDARQLVSTLMCARVFCYTQLHQSIKYNNYRECVRDVELQCSGPSRSHRRRHPPLNRLLPCPPCARRSTSHFLKPWMNYPAES